MGYSTGAAKFTPGFFLLSSLVSDYFTLYILTEMLTSDTHLCKKNHFKYPLLNTLKLYKGRALTFGLVIIISLSNDSLQIEIGNWQKN